MARKKPQTPGLFTTEDEPVCYVITAGIKKPSDRQLYLASFNDCDDYLISAVPTVTTYSRAKFLMDKCLSDYAKKAEKQKNTVAPDLKIVVWNE